MRKALPVSLLSGVWFRVISLATVLFFVFLADAILSDWVPVYMQEVSGSSLVMGLIMSFSSIVGLGADLIFPQLLKGTAVKKLMFMAIASGLLFGGILFASTWWPVIIVFLLAMTVWGVYYEILSFAMQEFVAEEAQTHQRSQFWAVLGTFRSLAYFLGPILGSLLMIRGDRSVLIVTGIISLFAYLLFLTLRIGAKKPEMKVEKIDLRREVAHWLSLSHYVWPMLMAMLVLGLVDVTFWTTGAVLTEQLAESNFWGGLFLPMYTLPSLFVGLLVWKWGLFKGKKKWAESFMFLGGAFLVSLFWAESVFYKLAAVFLSSVMLSASYPLIEAVCSDIVVRMGGRGKHMIGLSSSMVSLAYVIGPTFSGLVASRLGEEMTFVVVGGILMIVSAILLAVTPKKLRLPQKEIKSWE